MKYAGLYFGKTEATISSDEKQVNDLEECGAQNAGENLWDLHLLSLYFLHYPAFKTPHEGRSSNVAQTTFVLD